MKYVMLIMNNPDEIGKLSPDAIESWSKDVYAWYEQWGPSGKLTDSGQELDEAHTAKTIRAGGITDGPFIEAKEVVGGFTVLETDTMDEAVDIAKTWPGIEHGLITVEVRPVYVRD